MKKIVYASLLILLTNTITAQSVGIGTTTSNNSAILDLTSLDKALLVPRVGKTGHVQYNNRAHMSLNHRLIIFH